MKRPVKVELWSSRPMVRVCAEPPVLVTRPEPVSAPMVWPKLLRLSVAEAPTVTAVRLGSTFAALAMSEPSLRIVAPL